MRDLTYRAKCPVCGRKVVKRANGKLYRHLRIAPEEQSAKLLLAAILDRAIPPLNDFCDGTGRKVGR